MGVSLLSGLTDGPTLDGFRSFASELGVLFQIVDDILDVTGTDAALGKPQGSDERHGKRTYVCAVRDRRGAPPGRRLARAGARVAAPRGRRPAGADELERITDFIHSRTS